MNIIKIGPVELTEREAREYFEQGIYLVTYSKIYKIVRRNGAFHGKQVHESKGMTRRGRFFAMTVQTIRDVFGLDLG